MRFMSVRDATVGTVSEGLRHAVRRLDERVVRDSDVRASHWYGPPPEDDRNGNSYTELPTE